MREKTAGFKNLALAGFKPDTKSLTIDLRYFHYINPRYWTVPIAAYFTPGCGEKVLMPHCNSTVNKYSSLV